MAVNIYEKAGWLDFSKILKKPTPFTFITGGRGIGKSFGCLKYLIEHGESFLYLRRTETEAKLQANPLTSQLSPVCENLGLSMEVKTVDKIAVATISNGSRCFLAALSTFSNLRGIDLSECGWIVYDEFIPEIHARKIKEEGLAFSNVYETTNRNRELEGREPVRAVLLSNALNLDADIFRTFNLIPIYEEMMEKGEEVHTEDVKTVILPQNSPISGRKNTTVLYRATSQEYAEMALKNRFIQNDFSLIKKRQNLTEYKAIIQIGDITILRHKTRKQFYATAQKMKAPKKYPDTIAGRQMFKRDTWTRLYWAYLDGDMFFDSFLAMSLFLHYYEL